ncbi:MAG: DUF4263 domain-containing protein [Desulfobacterales bacterium]|nr:DUF4263 domain-containing protein [Desulfobacterales bacterium]
MKIESVIQKGAGERDIQTLLKENLHVLGEVHSHPRGEYIAFSEYPIGNGFSDFVVFNSVSRMEIVIFEIKGADFNFLKSNDTFHSKIEEAITQVRSRFGYINREYEGFRREAHNIRLSVEEGIRKYNSVTGKNGYLQCDANKDVLQRGVVIGGRSVNDRLESKLKTDFEISTMPHIKVESWDSWLKKVKNANNGFS